MGPKFHSSEPKSLPSCVIHRTGIDAVLFPLVDFTGKFIGRRERGSNRRRTAALDLVLVEHHLCQRIAKHGLGRTLAFFDNYFGYAVGMRVDGVRDIILKLGICDLFCGWIFTHIPHSNQEHAYEHVHPVHAELYLGAFLIAAGAIFGHKL